MKKVVRLTESDLTRIVKKVINESKKKYEYLDEHPSYDDLNSKITELKKIINTISKDIVGDESKKYVQEYVDKKLFSK